MALVDTDEVQAGFEAAEKHFQYKPGSAPRHGLRQLVIEILAAAQDKRKQKNAIGVKDGN